LKSRALPNLIFFTLLALFAVYGLARLGVINLPQRYDPLALPDLTQPPNFITKMQLKLVDADPENCRIALSRAGLVATLKNQTVAQSYCSKQETIELRRLSLAKLKPEDTRCAIAARLYMWERHVVQPAALKYFSEPIAEILHFGSYSCRTIRGSSQASQHATANAFDISGFKLKSGKTISLKADWPTRGPKANFLREVRDGACDYFNLTLSPDYNADHADHFHVDMGWYRGCN
jgi:hypothetical protein